MITVSKTSQRASSYVNQEIFIVVKALPNSTTWDAKEQQMTHLALTEL